MAHYNIRADPKLGVGVVALCRIPCACQGCLDQLLLPWDPKVAFTKQICYSRSSHLCKYWPLFHGLNDWKVVKLVQSTKMETLEETKAMALEGIAT